MLVINFIMSRQSTPNAEKQRDLRKIVKTLSKVSNVDTSQIRKDIQKSAKTKNRDSGKYQPQKDHLLKQTKTGLPNVLFTHRLFEERSNKVGSLKEKKIQSQACLRQVNFQYRKLQSKKERIAKKHLQSIRRYKNAQLELHPTLQSQEIKNLRISQAFQKVVIPDDEDLTEKNMLQKIQNTLNSTKKRIKTLYNQHYQSVKAENRKNRNYLPNPQIQSQRQAIYKMQPPKLHETAQEQSRALTGFTKTQSVLIKKTNSSRKKQSLIDLIEMSRIRADLKQETIDERLTKKEIVDQKATLNMISSLKEQIERENKLRESIVFGGLKKLLYGDRRGRFIQDNTFKTRLQGENSPEYLKILKQQEDILLNFDGSLINRRNLAQKFSNILGKINKKQKNVHELKNQY